MYLLVLALLVAAGLWTLWQGIERSSRSRIIGGVAIIIVTVGFFGLMSLWGEMLSWWFGELAPK